MKLKSFFKKIIQYLAYEKGTKKTKLTKLIKPLLDCTFATLKK
jgi:hypothetical protein